MNFLDPRLPERFWSKCTPEPNSGCWLWLASLNMQGYGRIGWRAKSRCGYVGAHRFAYVHLVGEIPRDRELDHLCRTRLCVNPSHVEVVSHAENMRRSPRIAAQLATTHCPHGHPYDERNTFVRRIGNGGRRECRACARERVRARDLDIVVDESGGRSRHERGDQCGARRRGTEQLT